MTFREYEGHYVDKCEECSGNIIRSTTTDQQIGRCKQCDYHENDHQFHQPASKELDFND